jgi:hypothetical protein
MRLYLTAVEKAFGWGKVDYAMLVKLGWRAYHTRNGGRADGSGMDGGGSIGAYDCRSECGLILRWELILASAVPFIRLVNHFAERGPLLFVIDEVDLLRTAPENIKAMNMVLLVVILVGAVVPKNGTYSFEHSIVGIRGSLHDRIGPISGDDRYLLPDADIYTVIYDNVALDHQRGTEGFKRQPVRGDKATFDKLLHDGVVGIDVVGEPIRAVFTG